MIECNIYEGVYGKTLRIDTHDNQELNKIREIFAQFESAGKKQRLGISSLEDIKRTGFADLVLQKSNQKHFISLYNEITVKDGVDGPVFTWLISDEECERCEGLINNLIEGGNAGHQYLLMNERLIIEIAYNE